MGYSIPKSLSPLEAMLFASKQIIPKGMAFLKKLIRSRIVLFLLVFISVIYTILHALARHDIVISDYPRLYDGVEYEFLTDGEILFSNSVVTDILIQKCLRRFDWGMPYDWERKYVKLNLFPESFLIFNYFLFVRKSQIEDADRYIIDIMFTLTADQPSTKVQGSKFIKRRLSSKGYMWLNYIETLDENIPVLRGIDVFYGNDDFKDPRKYWNLHPHPIPIPGKYLMNAKVSTLSASVLSRVEIFKHEPFFKKGLKKNGILLTDSPTFKIMQLSDMHIGQDAGVCYDDCRFDNNTLKFVKSAIEKEGDVRLIVITGDMIDSARTVHFPSAILKALSPVIESGIPFVFTFGETDTGDSSTGYPEAVFQYISTLLGCYNKGIYQRLYRFPGLSDGSLKIYNVPQIAGALKIDVLALALKHADALVSYLDTSRHVISDSQTTYLYRVTHESGMETEFKLLFTHHPLPFSRSRSMEVVGSFNDTYRAWAEADEKLLDDINANGYKAIGFGHEHENDACIWEEKDGQSVRLCYSGVTGECGRTEDDPSYKRRLRVFEFDFGKKKILTWKRDHDDSFDTQEIWAAYTDG